MPRKAARQISIEGRTYRWRARYGHCWQDGYCIPLRLVVELGSPNPGQRLRATFRNGRNDIWHLEDQAVTPAVVRRTIEGGLQRGWRPGQSDLPLFGRVAWLCQCEESAASSDPRVRERMN